MMTDHERIDSLLASHARTWHKRAHEHDEAAERARAAKKRAMDSQPNIPEDIRGQLEGHHDHEIAAHEKRARVLRRRSEHAAAGVLLDSPDEGDDSDYARDHAELIAMAARTGRLHHSDEHLDD